MASTRKPRPGDLMRGTKFVKLTVFHDLVIAEAVQAALREQGVGAVIINDENHQAEPAEKRAEATSLEGFRIEVPEVMVEKARRILNDVTRDET